MLQAGRLPSGQPLCGHSFPRPAPAERRAGSLRQAGAEDQAVLPVPWLIDANDSVRHGQARPAESASGRNAKRSYLAPLKAVSLTPIGAGLTQPVSRLYGSPIAFRVKLEGRLGSTTSAYRAG